MAKTFYTSSTDAATGVHAATHEQLLTLTDPGTGSPETIVSNALAGGTSQLVYCATTASGEPGAAQWPTGTYTHEIDCTAVGSSITYGLLTINGAAGHFARVDSGLTTDREAKAQTAAAFSGTGIKSASTGSVSWSAGADTDRFEVLLAAARPASHGNESISIQINETDDASVGPWTASSIESGDGASALAVTASGTGASTAESDGTSAAAITGAGVGASTAESDGTSAAAITVAAVGEALGETPEPLARYWINEASSGQGPTQVLDDIASPVHLDITYVGDTPAYTSISAGSGHTYPTDNGDGSGAFSAELTSSDKIFTALDGATQATYEIVVDIPQGTIDGIGIPVNIFGIYSSDWVNDPLGLFWNDDELIADMSGPSGYRDAHYTTGLSAGVHVIHYVLDTTLGTAADRIKLYFDGDLLTPTSTPNGTPAEDAQIDIPATDHHVQLGGAVDFAGGGWTGAIYYAAIYDVPLTATQVSDQADALAASNDPPGSVGTSSIAVTATGVGASTAETDGASAAAVTATGTGSSTAAAVGTSSATVTGAGVATSTAAAVGTSAATVTGSGVGSSTAEADGASSAAVTVTGTGSSTAEADGASSIVVTVDAEGSEGGSLQSGAGTSAAAVTVSATGASTAETDGTSSAALTGTATGAAIFSAAGTSSAAVTVAATGSSTGAGAGLSACTVTAAGTATSTAAATGTSSAVITVLGAGSTAEGGIESGAGTCAIACTVAGAASSTAETDGTCSIALTVAGAGADVRGAVGLASCVVTVAAAGSATAESAGTSSIIVSAAGLATATAASAASGSITVTVTGVSGSVIPPDPPIVEPGSWTKAAYPTSVTAWAKASGAPTVTTWTKNEQFELPLAA